MRRLLWLLVVLAVLWSGWWWLAATMVERGVTGWMEAQRAQGWQAEVGALSVAGFPLSIATSIEDIYLSDPASGGALAASQLDVSVPAYWPVDVTLRLPDTPVSVRGPAGEVFLRADDGVAEVNLHPGTALELEGARVASGPWEVNSLLGNLLSAQDLTAEVAQDADVAEAYHLTLNAGELVPGDMLRTGLALPADWPRAFDAFEADMTVRFDMPLNRFSLEGRRPQPREAEIRGIDVVWGSLRLHAEGVIVIDEAGAPEGALGLTVDNWPLIMEQAQAMGVVTATQRSQAELVLNALGNLGGARQNLGLDLRFEGGEAFLGPILLGPAPRVVWP